MTGRGFVVFTLSPGMFRIFSLLQQAFNLPNSTLSHLPLNGIFTRGGIAREMMLANCSDLSEIHRILSN